ncbi:MAG: PDZ domain-containing protein [Acidobacteria bacterium]|nr:PDZ domain-containing protein [Acidobacteriota bacterium]
MNTLLLLIRSIRASVWVAAALCLLITMAGALCPPARAQSARLERERGHVMLNSIKAEIKSNYYDPTFRGMDLDARFKEADEKIKTATSISEIFGIIAQAVVDLEDSHTLFLPPERASRTEYGWRVQMIGAKCYIVAVQPGSDAEAKGLKPGDQVLSLNGYTPTRDDLWKMQYTYYALKPQTSLQFVVQSPGGQPRELEVMSKVTTRKRVLDLTGSGATTDVNQLIRDAVAASHYNRHRYYETPDVLIWKMPQFDLSNGEVDDIMGKVARRKTLILDLRGNGGGYEVTLQRLIGNVFDHDIRIGDLKRRNETKPLIAKTRGEKAFKGQLIVLVDSRSGSAAEIFARVVQLEKRGMVIGDRTAGAVMRSKTYPHNTGVDQIAFYAVSVTDADVVMTDGQSLEKVGVTPDQLLLPSAANLAAQRDPVMFRAAMLAGLDIEPAKLGTLFPVEWRKY